MLQATVEVLQVKVVGCQYYVVEVNGELGIRYSLVDVLFHEVSNLFLAKLLPVNDGGYDATYLSAPIIAVEPEVQCHLEFFELVLAALLANVLQQIERQPVLTDHVVVKSEQ